VQEEVAVEGRAALVVAKAEEEVAVRVPEVDLLHLIHWRNSVDMVWAV
jgi:hypothetical protein